jgi:hypothetical protein
MKKIDYRNLDLSCLSNICQYFDEAKLEKLGREVRFIEPSTSRLSAWMFLQLNTCLIDRGKECSLNDMAAALSDAFAIKLTKQSLDERFNTFGGSLDEKVLPNSF